MNPVPELVDLPDPATRPLVHPLDLAGARRPYAISLSIAELTGPLAVLVLGLAVWSVAHPPAIAILVAGIVWAAGYGATRWYRREAWAYIPRKRQDRGRALPWRWDAVRVAARATTVGAAAWLGARLLDQGGASVAVKATVLGMLAGLVLDLVLVAVWQIAADRPRPARPGPGTDRAQTDADQPQTGDDRPGADGTQPERRYGPTGPARFGLAAAVGLAAGTYLAITYLLDGESVFGPHASEIGFGFSGMVGVGIGLYAAAEINTRDDAKAAGKRGTDKAERAETGSPADHERSAGPKAESDG